MTAPAKEKAAERFIIGMKALGYSGVLLLAYALPWSALVASGVFAIFGLLFLIVAIVDLRT